MSERCSTRNRKGKRCGAWDIRGATRCALHANPGRAAELGSKHASSLMLHSRQNAVDLPYKPLKNSRDVAELLEETINRVRQGSLDLRAANTIGFLAGIHLRALVQQTEEAEKADERKAPGIYRAFFDSKKPQKIERDAPAALQIVKFQLRTHPSAGLRCRARWRG